MTRYLILFLAILPAATLGQQQQIDPDMLARLIPALESQRNRALTSEAMAQAQLSALQAELDKANARIKELESKLADATPASR